MCMNVDLPEPDGPTTVTNSPAAMSSVTPAQGVHHVVAHVVLLLQIAEPQSCRELGPVCVCAAPSPSPGMAPSR